MRNKAVDTVGAKAGEWKTRLFGCSQMGWPMGLIMAQRSLCLSLFQCIKMSTSFLCWAVAAGHRAYSAPRTMAKVLVISSLCKISTAQCQLISL